MNLSEAISLFEERCESTIDVAALECIRAALAESTNSSHNTASTPVCPKCGRTMAVLSGNHGFSGKVCLFCE
jgi:tRNA(Ile2) C34 agmatinyltransferase TiaS